MATIVTRFSSRTGPPSKVGSSFGSFVWPACVDSTRGAALGWHPLRGAAWPCTAWRHTDCCRHLETHRLFAMTSRPLPRAPIEHVVAVSCPRVRADMPDGVMPREVDPFASGVCIDEKNT
jgi:hypothetical protein